MLDEKCASKQGRCVVGQVVGHNNAVLGPWGQRIDIATAWGCPSLVCLAVSPPFSC